MAKYRLPADSRPVQVRADAVTDGRLPDREAWFKQAPAQD
jgi:hypothetical protein